jgi:hypothetical protein
MIYDVYFEWIESAIKAADREVVKLKGGSSAIAPRFEG